MKRGDNVLLLLVFNEINLSSGIMISLVHSNSLMFTILLFDNHNFSSKCPVLTGWENS